MIKKFFIIAFLLCLLTPVVFAQVQVTAKINPSEISIDEDTELTVSVSGSLQASEPVAPKVAGLDIVQTGSSTQIQVINGAMSTVAQYVYAVVASNEGVFNIPPFTIFASGNEYQSNPVTLTVKKSGYSTPPPSVYQQNPQNTPGPTYNQNQDSDGKSDLPFWIATSVSNPNPFVSEQIIFRFKLYTQENIETGDLKLPEFDDFWAEELVSEERGSEMINGQRYATFEKSYALFPLKPGAISIAETSLQIKYQVFDRADPVDPFFGRNPLMNFGRGKTKSKVLRAKPVQLNVKALPSPVPADFTNLVGQFGANVNLSETEVKAGDSITLSVEFSGSGNIKDATLPKLNLPDVKTYDDKPAVDVKKTPKGLSGKKTFKIAMVPSRAGKYEIPPFSLSYFDNLAGQYVTLSFDQLSFNVAAAADEKINSVITSSGKDEGQNLKFQDLAPLHDDITGIVNKTPDKMSPYIFDLIVYGFPFGFLVLLLFRRFKPSSEDMRQMSDKRSALKVFSKATSRSDLTNAQLLDALRDYMAVTLQRVGKAMTASEMEDSCIENRVPLPTAKRLREVVERLEASQYGFVQNLDLKKTADELYEIFSQIQKYV